MDLQSTFGAHNPVIGMVHIDPLPGAPRSTASLGTVVERACLDAERLVAGGVDGVLIENFGDAPFYPDDVPKHTVAAMTRVAGAVDRAVDVPIGINVLRNDAVAAVSIAAAVDTAFVRVNVHSGARVTDQGVVEGRAHETIRLRERLGTDIAIAADIDVKHSTALGTGSSVAADFDDLVHRGLADAVIVSGEGTGRAVDRSRLHRVAHARDEREPSVSVFVGSGVTADTAAAQLERADGLIVGTACKRDGVVTNPVDTSRVEALVAALEEFRRK
ncbi:BtpA/SgcQ family protein [Haloferacaceae archaeon DSL9]